MHSAVKEIFSDLLFYYSHKTFPNLELSFDYFNEQKLVDLFN